MPDSLPDSDTEDDPPIRSKVGRVIDEYGLDGFGEDLERRWLGLDGERESLRDLADAFNREVLAASLEAAGEQPIEGEVENHYRLLTAEDVRSSARTQAETRLARNGISVESLERDFVSHQAIHTYLTEVRGATLPEDDTSPEATISNRLDAILRLRNRLVAVTERSLESLAEAGHLSLGDFDVLVGITVYCSDCGASMDLTDLVDRGGCGCQEDRQ